MPNTTRYLTTEELAAHFRVHVETVRRWARAGRIPSLNLPGERRFDLAVVEAALADPATAEAATDTQSESAR